MNAPPPARRPPQEWERSGSVLLPSPTDVADAPATAGRPPGTLSGAPAILSGRSDEDLGGVRPASPDAHAGAGGTTGFDPRRPASHFPLGGPSRVGGRAARLPPAAGSEPPPGGGEWETGRTPAGSRPAAPADAPRRQCGEPTRGREGGVTATSPIPGPPPRPRPSPGGIPPGAVAAGPTKAADGRCGSVGRPSKGGSRLAAGFSGQRAATRCGRRRTRACGPPGGATSRSTTSTTKNPGHKTAPR